MSHVFDSRARRRASDEFLFLLLLSGFFFFTSLAKNPTFQLFSIPSELTQHLCLARLGYISTRETQIQITTQPENWFVFNGLHKQLVCSSQLGCLCFKILFLETNSLASNAKCIGLGGKIHTLLRTIKYCSTLTVHTSFVIFIIDAEHGLNISIEFALSVFITDMSEK